MKKKHDDHKHDDHKHDDHKDVCCDKKEDDKKDDKKCDGKKKDKFVGCAEEMAKQLKKLKDKEVMVFEKNAVAVGTVKKVKGEAVLVLVDGEKVVFFGKKPKDICFDKLFISICEITEVKPLEKGDAKKALDDLKQM